MIVFKVIAMNSLSKTTFKIFIALGLLLLGCGVILAIYGLNKGVAFSTSLSAVNMGFVQGGVISPLSLLITGLVLLSIAFIIRYVTKNDKYIEV